MTGGGSGGHITPLLSLAHELKRQAPSSKIVYIGLKKEKIGGLQGRYTIFDEIFFTNSGKFRRYHGENLLSQLVDVKTLILNIADFFKVIAGIFGSMRLLGKINPDIVFSKGGYVAVPVGIAAKFRQIPIVTHDSDIVAGLANRIIGRWATIHATGMPPEYYSYPKETIRYVGIPVDERIKEITSDLKSRYKNDIGAAPDQQVVVIGGAGLGARDVNNHIINISPTLLQKHANLKLYHIAGTTHEKEVNRLYDETLSKTDRLKVEVLSFTDEFYKYTGAADLVITRAGATTIAELAMQGKPVILIPAPHLTGGHQLKNAQQLQKSEAAVVADNDISDQELLVLVEDLLNDQNKREIIGQNLKNLAKPEAAARLAEVLLTVAGRNRLN